MDEEKVNRNFPTMSIINGVINAIGFAGICGLIWMVSGYANRIENLEKAQLEAKATSAEARAQNVKQYVDINETLKAFPLATEQLARAIRDIQELRDNDKQMDIRVRELERSQGKIEDRVTRFEVLVPVGPVNLRDSVRR